MVVAMKVISLGFDLDRGAVVGLPSPAEFLGYVFFVGTVIFGPWISFSSYKNAIGGRALVRLPPWCPYGSIIPESFDAISVPQSFRWLCCSSLRLLRSQICLLVSTCIAPYFFTVFVPLQGGSVTQK